MSKRLTFAERWQRDTFLASLDHPDDRRWLQKAKRAKPTDTPLDDGEGNG